MFLVTLCFVFLLPLPTSNLQEAEAASIQQLAARLNAEIAEGNGNSDWWQGYANAPPLFSYFWGFEVRYA